jgi:hypothetical protein
MQLPQQVHVLLAGNARYEALIVPLAPWAMTPLAAAHIELGTLLDPAPRSRGRVRRTGQGGDICSHIGDLLSRGEHVGVPQCPPSGRTSASRRDSRRAPWRAPADAETAVEPQFLCAEEPPALSRAEVDERKADGLLHLVSELAGKKHPGEMRFDHAYHAHRVGVGCGVEQRQLARQSGGHTISMPRERGARASSEMRMAPRAASGARCASKAFLGCIWLRGMFSRPPRCSRSRRRD